ncbi:MULTISPECIES: hypothetical protein [Methylobacterium]|uniref:Uncharacterized protein n=1 Tax=Methylobacterium longum TaxID=767694 RepID=A0ABT8AK61_9HYPH|nr:MULTISPECIES: hypothetical protein [Methylobacterium]MCJ2099596.1 hypothetical protein [Methylobacterium sp. E-046]MDN3569951.1 hypothetical protein [Methylobacterium longum]
MDVDTASFDAPTLELAIARATALTGQFLGQQPGVATLTSTVRGLIWSQRYKMPEPPRP